MDKGTAMSWLWGTAALNLVLGALLWIVNSRSDFDSLADEATALIWQTIGSNLFGFGVLVLIITFATSAITADLSLIATLVSSVQISTYKMEQATSSMAKSVESINANLEAVRPGALESDVDGKSPPESDLGAQNATKSSTNKVVRKSRLSE